LPETHFYWIKPLAVSVFLEASAILPTYLYRPGARLNGGWIQETSLTSLAPTGEFCCVVTEAAASNQNQEPSY